jgi:crotonobetainyl-CoA:carnitine CoA-transferase CaiB-like acyl-CoA transferase
MKALDGITVLDLGMVMQGPLAAQMLGDYGANVIKIERPGPGDLMRGLDAVGPAAGGMSCYYAALGRNKKSVCLDLKTEAGREVLWALIRRADVLIHNFRNGVIERLGFSYEAVAAQNSRLVYAVSSAFGDSGPMAGMPGQDLLAQAFSGYAMSGVEPGEPPRFSASPIVDYAAGLSLTQGILAALFERERSGKGQRVSTSLFDVALAVQLLEVASHNMYGYRDNWARHSLVFRTRDGWITVVVLFRDAPMRRMCAAFEVEMPEDRPADGVAANASLQAWLQPTLLKFTTAQCIERLSAQELLCAPALALPEVLEHPQAGINGMLWDVPVPGQGVVKMAGNPVRLSRTPTGVTRGPSGPGADSVEVLRDAGFSAEAIAALVARGAVCIPEDK